MCHVGFQDLRNCRCYIKGVFSAGFFFRCRTQNSRQKKLKLKQFSRKTQAIFTEKLKKSEIFVNLDNNLTFLSLKLNSYFGLSLFNPVLGLNKSPENEFLSQKLKKSLETQGNFPKTQAKFLKNSIYRKVHSLALPPKRRKNPVQL